VNFPKPSGGTFSSLAITRIARVLSQVRTKLLLLVLLLVFPAVLLVIYSSFQQRRIEKERARENAVAISRLAAAQQEQFIRNARQLLATLTEFSFLTLTTNVSFAEVHLLNLKKLSPDYLTFGLIELDGTVFCSASPTNNGTSLRDRSYFQRVRETKAFAIGDYQVGRLTTQPSLNFGYPVFDENAQLKRVVFSALKLSLLSESLSHVPMPSDATVTVIDRSGNILACHPYREKLVGQSLVGTPLFKWALANKQGVAELPGIDGTPQLNAITCITEGQLPSLFVSVGIPVETSFAQANEKLARNSLLLAVITTCLLTGAWWYARRFFLQPVNTLVAAANRIAAGDLTTRTHLPNGIGELNSLAKAFDTMASTLERRQAEIAEANANLERRVEERTRALAETNRELESFSYSVSHDLRAPLRHIGGFVGLLQLRAGALLDEKCQRYLKMISSSTKEMGTLVDDLLSFSRMGRAEMRATRFNFEQLTRNTIEELAPDAAGRDIVWKIAALPEIQADPALMRQVMTNLISNALKYSRTRAKAEIEIGCQPNDNGHHVFFVRDNGVGFDMQYAAKLFGVFQRLHSTDEFEGTGIGLANVHRIIGRHGGRTWAEGAVNGGATFYFSIPKSPPATA
jgi:signal transduction histidine kinase